MEKLIITAAICGAEVTKEQNLAVPYTVEEIVREAKSAYDAGAAIVHLHVREDDGTPTQSRERFRVCIEAIKRVIPDVILIPSTVMTVAENHSKNVNIEACEAVEQWLLSEEAQKLILQGYMHSVFKGMTEIPYASVDTDGLIAKDLGVNWENAYQNREAINMAWTETVTTK